MDSLELIKETYNERFEETKTFLIAFPWYSKRVYRDWLIQTYAYVKHTTRLTALAAARIDVEDPMHQHMLNHAAEEKNHQQLIINDLEVLDPDYVWNLEELPITTAFYQSLYYQIDHISPYALFGRVIPLEGLASIAGPILCDKVKRAYEGQNVSSFLEVHAEADPGHVERAFNSRSICNC
jgi:thiaminase